MPASTLARGFASSAHAAAHNNRTLSRMLQDQEFRSIGKGSKTTLYPQWNQFEENKALTPISLTYKVVTPAVRTSRRRPAVAAPPAVTRKADPFHKLSLDPRSLTTNSSVLSHYVTEMGKIKPRTITNLTLKSQRLLGRTIRRAKMMGIMPHLSKGL